MQQATEFLPMGSVTCLVDVHCCVRREPCSQVESWHVEDLTSCFTQDQSFIKTCTSDKCHLHIQIHEVNVSPSSSVGVSTHRISWSPEGTAKQNVVR